MFGEGEAENFLHLCPVVESLSRIFLVAFSLAALLVSFLSVIIQCHLLVYSFYSEDFIILDARGPVRLLNFEEYFLINVSVNTGQVAKLLFVIVLRKVDFTRE